MAEKLTLVQRLMAGMDSCALARGRANWTNGYRTGKPSEEENLYPREREEWKRCDVEEERFRRLCQRVLREARSERRRGKR